MRPPCNSFVQITALLGLSLFLVLPGHLHAQDTLGIARSRFVAAVTPGTRVRILAPQVSQGRRVSVFEALRGDTLMLRDVSDSTAWAVPLMQIQRIEVSRGLSRSAGRIIGGPVIGLLAGGLLAGGVGYLATMNADVEPGNGVILVIPGAAIGAFIGALVGIGNSRTEHWEVVPLPGSALSVAVRFRR